MIELSIIIATYNRGEKLRRTLQSLVDQTVDADKWEAVVVNNNSADNSAEVFEKFAAEHPELNLKMVSETRQGLSHARNKGIKEACGGILAIIDDDEEVNPSFMEAYMDFFARHPSAAMAGGRVLPRYETGRPRWMSRWTERPIAGTLDRGPTEKPFRSGVSKKGVDGYPAGGNMAIRRRAVERYGVFDTSLGRTGSRLIGGEEKELFHRLVAAGQEIWYTPGPVIHHLIGPEKLTLDYFRRLAHGVGASERVRTMAAEAATAAHPRALSLEAIKWVATLILAAGYTVTGRPSKAKYLLILRSGITMGLINR